MTPFILAGIGFLIGGSVVCSGYPHWVEVDQSQIPKGVTWQNRKTGQSVFLPIGQTPPDDMPMCQEIGGPHDMIHYPSWASAIGAVSGFLIGKMMEN